MTKDLYYSKEFSLYTSEVFNPPQ